MTEGLHFGHYADLLQHLEDGSINLFLVDSPYGNTDLAFDKQPVDWAGEFWPLVRRKLDPNGVVVCFGCERFTFDLMASNWAWYCYRMVWAKSRASRILDAGWRPLCNHEDIVVFSPNIKAATYNPQMLQTTRNVGRVKRQDDAFDHYKASRGGIYEDTGLRHPTTVLDFGSVATMAPHFNPTVKPVALMQYLVTLFTNRDDKVADPFSGDGTVLQACRNTGRYCVSTENNRAQFDWTQAYLAQQAPLFQ
ncbi:MAG: DNA methyltransferase [Janthinobacterium lividum]